jgi:TFIIF-interacting CTD phosphatase-like protein
VIDSQNVTISTSGSTSVADSATETHTHSASLTFAGGQRLLLSKEEALRVQKLKTTALRSTNKLALVLDLDHTLVHATSAWTGYRDVPSGGLRSISIEESPGNPPKIYVVKLRPNVESFLRSASEICQMRYD